MTARRFSMNALICAATMILLAHLLTILLSAQAMLEMRTDVACFPVVAGITFPQGAVFDADGNMYFVNYLRDGTIGRLSPDGQVAVWLEQQESQFAGLAVDSNGKLIAADYKGKRLVRIRPNRTIETLATGYEQKPFRGLNNVCSGRNGLIYFTEPDSSKDVPPSGRVYAYTSSGTVVLVAEGLAMPNGLAVSPNGLTLLVVESRRNRVLSYQLTAEGKAADRAVFYNFTPPHPEAVTFDERGRVWVTRWNDEIDVFSPDGIPIERISAGGDMVTNITWWRQSLYVSVAGRHSIHKIDLGMHGALP